MRMLRVYGNPYLMVDHEGRLCGACPTHSIEGGHTPLRREFVGSKLNADKTKITSKGDPTSLTFHEQDTHWAHSPEVVEVPATPDHYYFQRLVHGDLIPADKKTAEYAGLRFEEPADVFARLRKAAVAKWVAMYGEEPAFASDPCPMFPKPEPKAALKSTAPASAALTSTGSQ